jgi:hypothetical protein
MPGLSIDERQNCSRLQFQKTGNLFFYKIDSIPSPEISATPILQSPVFLFTLQIPATKVSAFTSVRCNRLHLVRETKQKSRYGDYSDLHTVFFDSL